MVQICRFPNVFLVTAFFGRGGEKISKSVGNVIDPLNLAQAFGVDVLRYFLMREVAFGQDGSYSGEAIVTKTNAELANSGFVEERTWEEAGTISTKKTMSLLKKVREASAKNLPKHFSNLAFSAGIEAWIKAVYACNQYIDEQAPWTLSKNDPKRMKVVLQTLFIAIHDLTIAIQPIIPEKAEAILDHIGVKKTERLYSHISNNSWFDELLDQGFLVDKPTPVFPRLDAELLGSEKQC